MGHPQLPPPLPPLFPATKSATQAPWNSDHHCHHHFHSSRTPPPHFNPPSHPEPVHTIKMVHHLQRIAPTKPVICTMSPFTTMCHVPLFDSLWPSTFFKWQLPSVDMPPDFTNPAGICTMKTHLKNTPPTPTSHPCAFHLWHLSTWISSLSTPLPLPPSCVLPSSRFHTTSCGQFILEEVLERFQIVNEDVCMLSEGTYDSELGSHPGQVTECQGSLAVLRTHFGCLVQ